MKGSRDVPQPLSFRREEDLSLKEGVQTELLGPSPPRPRAQAPKASCSLGSGSQWAPAPPQQLRASAQLPRPSTGPPGASLKGTLNLETTDNVMSTAHVHLGPRPGSSPSTHVASAARRPSLNNGFSIGQMQTRTWEGPCAAGSAINAVYDFGRGTESFTPRACDIRGRGFV